MARRRAVSFLFCGFNALATTAAAQQSRQQMIDDARAMVQESWEKYGRSIEAIEVGVKCGVIDQMSANFSIQKIQIVMRDELIDAGLINDGAMMEKIDRITATSIEAGKKAAEGGACASMTLAERGRLRSMVSGLMRTPM
jgi:hypothetical protein